MSRTVVRKVDNRTVFVSQLPLRGLPGANGTNGTNGTNGVNGGIGSSAGFAALFAAASGMAIGAGITRVHLAGYASGGVGAAWYNYDGAVNSTTVAANPRTQFLAADGRGFKLDHLQHLTVEMFGAVSGGTQATNGANNHAAILAAINNKPDPARNYSPTVHFGIGVYYVSEVIDIYTCCHLKGHSNGQTNGSVQGQCTALEWPINTKCIRVQNSNTMGDTFRAVGDKNLSGSGSILEGLTIMQAAPGGVAGMGTDRDKHAIQLRGQGEIIRCSTYFIAGNSYHIVATAGQLNHLQGDANNWRMFHCHAGPSRGDGLYIEGNDVNAGYNISFHATLGVEGCGIRDSASLGNAHIQPHITGYGNGGVWHLGAIYQLISETAGIGGTTEPGTNGTVWYKIRDQAAVSAPFPQWVSGTDYYLECPLFIPGPSSVFGGYQEISTVLAHCPGAAMFSALFECTNASNRIISLASGGGLVSTTAIGTRRDSGSTTSTQEYADEGAYAETKIGDTDMVSGLRTKRLAILSHSVEQDGASARMQWHWQNKDQYLRYFNSKIMWSLGGPGTARTYGRTSGAQPYYFTLHDFALRSTFTSTDERIFGIRAAVPGHFGAAVGEYYWNTNPASSGLIGWSCKVAGAAGTVGTYGKDYLNERSSPTVGIGYVALAGGAVTQATSKTTAVTLNTVCGAITMEAGSLAANTVATFTLTNSTIATTDVVNISIKSGATAGAYVAQIDQVAVGSCKISVRNMTAGALAEAIVLNFAVIKAVAA